MKKHLRLPMNSSTYSAGNFPSTSLFVISRWKFSNVQHTSSPPSPTNNTNVLFQSYKNVQFYDFNLVYFRDLLDHEQPRYEAILKKNGRNKTSSDLDDIKILSYESREQGQLSARTVQLVSVQKRKIQF